MDAQYLISVPFAAIVGGLVVTMWKFQNSKIKDKMEKSTCKTQVKAFQKDLDKGVKRFEEISKSLRELSKEQQKSAKMLARMDERTLHIARKNGYSGP